MGKRKKANGYWTIERCEREAIKYKTKTEFCKNAPGAYTAALKHGWLDTVCSHMLVKWEKKWADKTICQNEALKYSTRSDFAKHCNGAYTYAMRHGFIDEICQHMQYLWKAKWNKKLCSIEAKKYQRRIDFAKNATSAYTYALRHGFLDEICNHMTFFYESHGNNVKRAEYVKNKLQISDEEWDEIYSLFVDAQTLHKTMQSNRISNKRCIYVAEFADNHVYIGLSNNLKNRVKQHLRSTKSQVFRHMQETDIAPLFRIIFDFEDEQNAQKNEGEALKKYKDDGWIILNKAKTGALGGHSLYWTHERCVGIAKKCTDKRLFRRSFCGAYTSASKNGWLEEILALIEANSYQYWTECKLYAEAMKYNSRKEFREKAYVAHNVALKRNILEQLYPRKKKKIKIIPENIKKAAQKYSVKQDFKAGAPVEYNQAKKMGIINKVCSHMKTLHPHKWNAYSIMQEAQKYDTKKEFRKNANGAYSAATKLGILDDVCKHMQIKIVPHGFKHSYWTKERCQERALLYTTRMDFKRGDGSAYAISTRKGWLNEICLHMHKPSQLIKWTKEACYDEALKYKTRKDFKTKSQSAYVTAGRNGWLKDICKHMTYIRKKQ